MTAVVDSSTAGYAVRCKLIMCKPIIHNLSQHVLSSACQGLHAAATKSKLFCDATGGLGRMLPRVQVDNDSLLAAVAP